MRIIRSILLLWPLLGVYVDATAAPAKAIATIQLSTKGSDVSFDQEAVEVPFAPEISIRFVNRAALDSQIQHNIAILKPGSTDEVIKELQRLSYDLEKIKSNPNVIAMTMAIEPGHEDILTFKPPAPGFYPYLCLMAGHGDMLNMRGMLAIKKH